MHNSTHKGGFLGTEKRTVAGSWKMTVPSRLITYHTDLARNGISDRFKGKQNPLTAYPSRATSFRRPSKKQVSRRRKLAPFKEGESSSQTLVGLPRIAPFSGMAIFSGCLGFA